MTNHKTPPLLLSSPLVIFTTLTNPHATPSVHVRRTTPCNACSSQHSSCCHTNRWRCYLAKTRTSIGRGTRIGGEQSNMTELQGDPDHPDRGPREKDPRTNRFGRTTRNRTPLPLGVPCLPQQEEASHQEVSIHHLVERQTQSQSHPHRRGTHC